MAPTSRGGRALGLLLWLVIVCLTGGGAGDATDSAPVNLVGGALSSAHRANRGTGQAGVPYRQGATCGDADEWKAKYEELLTAYQSLEARAATGTPAPEGVVGGRAPVEMDLLERVNSTQQVSSIKRKGLRRRRSSLLSALRKRSKPPVEIFTKAVDFLESAEYTRQMEEYAQHFTKTLKKRFNYDLKHPKRLRRLLRKEDMAVARIRDRLTERGIPVWENEFPRYSGGERAICGWKGIKCYHVHRTKLAMKNNFMAGIYSMILEESTMLVNAWHQDDSTYILNQITNLTRLRRIRMVGVNIVAFPPSFFDSMKSLRKVELGEMHYLTTVPRLRGPIMYLRIFNCAINELPEDFVSSLEALKGVSLRRLPLTRLPAFDPKTNKRLVRFDFHNMPDVTEMPMLAGLESLAYVRISHIPLTKIEGLEELDHLEEVEILYTQLRLLREDSFLRSRGTMKILNIVRSQLTKLPASVYNLPKLQMLNVGYNQISELPKGISRLKTLKFLDVKSNRLQRLPSDLWQLKHLMELRATRNMLTELPPIGDATGLEVRSLILHNNRLTSIPDLDARVMPFLYRLDVRQNSLRRPPRFLTKFTGFRKLQLSRNPIGRIDISWMNAQLTSVELVGCEITEIPEWIGNLTSIRRLQLNENQIPELPDSIGNLQGLQDLIVKQNRLVVLPRTLGRLLELRVIEAQRNKIVEFPYMTQSKVTMMRLEDNEITEIPPHVSNYIQLKHLRIDNNRVAIVRPEIGYLNNLLVLTMQGNLIKSLPDQFRQLKSLHYLDLSNNFLSAVGPWINGLRGLAKFSAASNVIDRFEVESVNLPRCHTIDLSHNQLHALPALNTPVRFVDISYNMISRLPVVDTAALETFRARDNQLTSVPQSIFCRLQIVLRDSSQTARSQGEMSGLQGNDVTPTSDFQTNFLTEIPDCGGRVRFSRNIFTENPITSEELEVPSQARLFVDASAFLPAGVKQRLDQDHTGATPEASPSLIETTAFPTHEELLSRYYNAVGYREGSNATVAADGAKLIVDPADPPSVASVSTFCWTEGISYGDRSLSIRRCKCSPGTYFRNQDNLHIMRWLSSHDLDKHCLPCPKAGSCSEGAIMCNSGNYLVDGETYAGKMDDVNESEKESGGESKAFKCNPCPTGATCNHNLVEPLPGYWRSESNDYVVYECESNGACLGGSNSTCRAGHTGSLCNKCEPGFYHAADGMCAVCPDRATSWFYVVAVVSGGASALCVLVFLGDGMVRQLAMRESVGDTGLVNASAATDMTGQFAGLQIDEMLAAMSRIAISFMQVISLIPRIYPVDFGAAFEKFADLLSWASLDVLAPSSFECAVETQASQYDFIASLMLLGMAPVLVGILGLSFYALCILVRLIIRPQRGPSNAFISAFLCKAVVLCWLFAYLPISLKTMQFFSCRSFDQGQTFYISADVSTRCYTPEWYSFLPFVALVVAYFVIGLPLLIFLAMLPFPRKQKTWCSRITDRLDQSSLALLLRRMFAQYRRKFQWWESVEMVRKLAITSVALHFAGAATVRVTVSILITFASIVAQFLFKPFETPFLNYVQTCQLILLYLTLSLGILKSVDVESKTQGLLAFVIVSLDLIFVVCLTSSVGIYILYQANRVFTAVRAKLRRQKLGSYLKL